MSQATLALLLRLSGASAEAPSRDGAVALLRREEPSVHQAHAYAALDGSGVYVYGWLRRGDEFSVGAVESLRSSLTASLGAAFTLDRLELQRAFDGASAGAPAPCFYAVETDPAEGSEEEMFRWYDVEHMPGLAAVPGCVRALRLINRDGGPRSHACYALTDAGVTSTPAWLAVRETAWSSRVRPNFRNTRRTMFRAL